MIVVTIGIVTPPCREGDRGATGAEHRKRQDEEDSKTSSVECTSDKVRVIFEDARTVVAEVELDEETTNQRAEEYASLRRIVRNIARILDELGQVNLVQGVTADLGDKLM